jgi:hypothetical protein
MPVKGQWTVDGSVEDFRALQVKLRATGQVGLRKNMRKAIVVATAPARKAVKDELEAVMPHGGGLNEYLAKSKITTAVLTGSKTAGVEVRGRGPKDRRRNQGQFRRINQGTIRRPVFADKSKPKKEWHWVDQRVPSGWWERSLAPFGPAAQAAQVAAMNATAREAGFTR